VTGAEHYAEAEQLLTEAAGSPYPDDPAVRTTVAVAQVHATLALAAATALDDKGDLPEADWEAWIDVASAARPTPGAPT
jgi:hypothetical protein